MFQNAILRNKSEMQKLGKRLLKTKEALEGHVSHHLQPAGGVKFTVITPFTSQKQHQNNSSHTHTLTHMYITV